MIYLVGGPPRCGKSTLAQSLCAAEAIPWISTDPLVQVLGMFDPRLRDAREDEMTTYARLVWPHLRTFIVHAGSCAPAITVEGDTFFPEQAAALAAEVPVRACFIGMSRVSRAELFAHMGHNDWLTQASPEVSRRLPGWIERRSALIERECSRLDLPYVDMAGDWHTGLRRAQDLLVESAGRGR